MTATLWPTVHTPIHLALHLLLPVLVAWIYWRPHWRRAALIMTAMNLVDLDHLFATPVFAPNRCSIGFHPLHSYYFIAICVIAAVVARRSSVIRLAAVGVLLHMAVDGIDYLVLQ